MCTLQFLGRMHSYLECIMPVPVLLVSGTSDKPQPRGLTWQPAYFVNNVVVNGKAWPYLRVRRRCYGFCILIASNARIYHLSLSTVPGRPRRQGFVHRRDEGRDRGRQHHGDGHLDRAGDLYRLLVFPSDLRLIISCSLNARLDCHLQPECTIQVNSSKSLYLSI